MESSHPHQRLLLFLFSTLILACIVSPLLAAGANWFMGQWPALMPRPVPFHRIFDRAFMFSGGLFFLIFRRALISAELTELYRASAAAASRDFFAGLAMALCSIFLIVFAMTYAEIFTPFFRLTQSATLRRIANGAASGLFAGTLEELFFRGILFMGLRARGYGYSAYLFANLFYATLHFIKPGDSYFLDQFELSAGFRHLGYTLQPFLDPLALVPGLFGLFLVGAVLSLSVDRSGKLYLAVGLHAGWVFGIKTLRVFGDFKRDQLGWLFGGNDPKIVSGVTTWIALLLTGVAVYYWTKSPAGRLTDRPDATRV